jgi:hypothetical protein
MDKTTSIIVAKLRFMSVSSDVTDRVGQLIKGIQHRRPGTKFSITTNDRHSVRWIERVIILHIDHRKKCCDLPIIHPWLNDLRTGTISIDYWIELATNGQSGIKVAI